MIRARSIFLSALVVAALQSGPSFADGLKDDYREPVRTRQWTGFHAGVHVGYQTGSFSGLLPAEPLGGLGNTLFTIIDPVFQGVNVFDTVDPLSIFAPRNGNYDGVVAGGHMGYDYQSGPFVIGMFTSLSWTSAKYSESAGLSAGLNVIDILPIATVDVAATGHASFEKNFEGRLGLRAGMAFDQFFVYGLGGIAMARAKYELNNTLGVDVAVLAPVVGEVSATVSTVASDSQFHTGYFFGLGAEIPLGRRWSMALEWQRTYYDSVNYKTQSTLNLSASAALNLVATQVAISVPGQTKISIGGEDDVRLKLNYRF
jgi:outer membrane immunogenic protein